MRHEVQRYLELLERRLATLRLLAAGLDEARSAFTDLNLEAMHQHIAHQENLCAEIRLLDTELRALKETLAGEPHADRPASEFEALARELDPASARHLQLLLSGLTAIQSDVRRLNRVHTELLRRSRRSVNVLLNFLANYTGTYSPLGSRGSLASSMQVGK